jgi:serine/threonine protein kinase
MTPNIPTIESVMTPLVYAVDIDEAVDIAEELMMEHGIRHLAVTDSDSLVGTTIGGRYIIESIIGEGGMGRVYLARHNVLDKNFAIKVLHPSLAAHREISGRFVREARAASSIESDHVVNISDFGTLEDGVAYFVMDYIRGKTLRDEIRDNGPLPYKDVASIGTQIALGLSEAHVKNIVHRDLKPPNILISRRESGPIQVKILDFGIAKCPTSDSGEALTLQGTVLGTPYYMAPEQVRNVEIDGRADIYTLGIVLYEMMTGECPFVGEATAHVMAQQIFYTPPPVREAVPGILCSAELEAIIGRCLEKEPAKRFQTARELAQALAAS